MNDNFNLKSIPLVGNFVRLEPYALTSKEELRVALDCDAEAWNLFSLSGQGEHFEQWWSFINQRISAGQWIAYTIRTLSDNRVVGTSSFLNIKPERQCVEIGATFLHPSVRATQVNPEAKLLMLRYAFGCGIRRVELLTDVRNIRSQAAIAKLGAVREGVLRRDRITWTGHIRDSVLFSITDLDWAKVESNLEARLAGNTIPYAATHDRPADVDIR